MGHAFMFISYILCCASFCCVQNETLNKTAYRRFLNDAAAGLEGLPRKKSFTLDRAELDAKEIKAAKVSRIISSLR